LQILERIPLPVIAFWPGQDAGSESMAKVYRQWREARPSHSLRIVRNLPPVRFLTLLTQSACLVGNSSAGIRECSYLGVPVVNIGRRQWGRERAANVRDVQDLAQLEGAVTAQIGRGRYPRSLLYGDGQAAARIAEVILS
jgi:UDP-N-acetylglucosamine 2-epimerase